MTEKLREMENGNRRFKNHLIEGCLLLEGEKVKPMDKWEQLKE